MNSGKLTQLYKVIYKEHLQKQKQKTLLLIILNCEEWILSICDREQALNVAFHHPYSILQRKCPSYHIKEK